MIIRKDKSFNTQLSPYQKNKPRTARIFIEQLTIKLRNKLNNTVIFYWITIKAKLKETNQFTNHSTLYLFTISIKR